MSTENQYHDQAPGCFSLIRGNRGTATVKTGFWAVVFMLFGVVDYAIIYAMRLYGCMPNSVKE